MFRIWRRKDNTNNSYEANAFAEDMQKSLDCGMMSHLPKPINVDKLYATIVSYVGKEEIYD